MTSCNQGTISNGFLDNCVNLKKLDMTGCD